MTQEDPLLALFQRPAAGRATREAEIEAALGEAMAEHGDRLVRIALDQSKSPVARVRALAGMVLGHASVSDPKLERQARRRLIELGSDTSVNVLSQVSVSLGRRPHRSVVESVLRLSRNRDPVVRWGALDSLARLSKIDPRAGRRLLAMARDPVSNVRAMVAWHLGWVKSTGSARALGRLSQDASIAVRRAAKFSMERHAWQESFGKTPTSKPPPLHIVRAPGRTQRRK